MPDPNSDYPPSEEVWTMMKAQVSDAASELPLCSGPLAHRIRIYHISYSEQIERLMEELKKCRAECARLRKKNGDRS